MVAKKKRQRKQVSTNRREGKPYVIIGKWKKKGGPTGSKGRLTDKKQGMVVGLIDSNDKMR